MLISVQNYWSCPEMSYEGFAVVPYWLLVAENNVCNQHWIFCTYDAGCCSEYQAEMLLKQSMHSGALVDQNPFVSILFIFTFGLGNSWSGLSLRVTRFIQMVSLFWSLHLCVQDRVFDILHCNCLAFYKISNLLYHLCCCTETVCVFFYS